VLAANSIMEETCSNSSPSETCGTGSHLDAGKLSQGVGSINNNESHVKTLPSFRERLTLYPQLPRVRQHEDAVASSDRNKRKNSPISQIEVDVNLEHKLEWDSSQHMPAALSSSRLAIMTRNLLIQYNVTRLVAQSSPKPVDPSTQVQDQAGLNGRKMYGTPAGLSLHAEFAHDSESESDSSLSHADQAAVLQKRWALLVQALCTQGLLPSSATGPPYSSVLLSNYHENANDALSGQRYHVVLPQLAPFDTTTRNSKTKSNMNTTIFTAFYPTANEGIGSWGVSPQGDSGVLGMLQQTPRELCQRQSNVAPMSVNSNKARKTKTSTPHMWVDMWTTQNAHGLDQYGDSDFSTSTNTNLADKRFHLSYGLSYTAVIEEPASYNSNSNNTSSSQVMASFILDDMAYLGVGVKTNTNKQGQDKGKSQTGSTISFPACGKGPLLPSYLDTDSQIITVIPNQDDEDEARKWETTLYHQSESQFIMNKSIDGLLRKVALHDARALASSSSSLSDKPWVSFAQSEQEKVPKAKVSLSPHLQLPVFDVERRHLSLSANALLKLLHVDDPNNISNLIRRERNDGAGTLLTCAINRHASLHTHVTMVDLFPITALNPLLHTMEVWSFIGITDTDAATTSHFDPLKLMFSPSHPHTQSSKVKTSILKKPSELANVLEITISGEGSATVSTSKELPPQSAMCLVMDYARSFRPFDDFGATPNRGIEIPASFATFSFPCDDEAEGEADNRMHFASGCCSKLDRGNCSPPAWYNNPHHLEGPVVDYVTVYGAPLIIMPPIPDMSMPFNVISITSTFFVFVLGSLLNILVRKASERITKPLLLPSNKPKSRTLKERIKEKLRRKFHFFLAKKKEGTEESENRVKTLESENS
jgi:hypothetical protein